MQKKWDVYVYGDVNIDLVVPGVESLPEPGSEVDVPVMETFPRSKGNYSGRNYR